MQHVIHSPDMHCHNIQQVTEWLQLQWRCAPSTKAIDSLLVQSRGQSAKFGPTVQVPRVDARLTTFLTRFEAQQQLSEAKGMLQGHQAAHRELKGSPCMAAALEQTLAMGNFLNWGTRLGQAAGFRLRNLPKLQVRLLLCRRSAA